MTGKEAILSFFFFHKEKWRRKEGRTEYSKDLTGPTHLPPELYVREKEAYKDGGDLVQESRATFREAKMQARSLDHS